MPRWRCGCAFFSTWTPSNTHNAERVTEMDTAYSRTCPLLQSSVIRYCQLKARWSLPELTPIDRLSRATSLFANYFDIGKRSVPDQTCCHYGIHVSRQAMLALYSAPFSFCLLSLTAYASIATHTSISLVTTCLNTRPRPHPHQPPCHERIPSILKTNRRYSRPYHEKRLRGSLSMFEYRLVLPVATIS